MTKKRKYLYSTYKSKRAVRIVGTVLFFIIEHESISYYSDGKFGVAWDEEKLRIDLIDPLGLFS